ncbi:hypothetical protein [Desulfoscipio geothermicus]|uniref:Uncharacterized protein n=1 Tax=Desulfoscipio geothermicus DSM 3669 TaxID=1121426 RepID=A0A1I6DW55_9FIRM|nr:hypothetical protein [Desulfoscipio geothermicus]SFR09729.1 hypothetical protein SAMN05660706_11942 [Desulfoscipio geothermicus DSM 3669]
MKKVPLVISLVIAFCLTLGSIAYASIDNMPKSVSEIVKYNSTIQETPNPELIEKANMQNKLSIKNLETVEETELKELFNDEQNIDEGQVIIMSPVTVTLGTDKTLTTADDGDDGGSTSGAGAVWHRYTVSSRKAEANSWAGGWGTADAYAFVGQRFITQGTTSKTAQIIFSGIYKGDMVGGINGSASAEVKIKLWDATDGVWIDSKTVASASSTNNISKTLNGNINHVITATLQPNHEYFPYIHIVTAAAEYGTQISNSDFYGDSDHMIQYSSIKIDFV